MSAEPVTDLDHARYDRDGWMETALAAQRRIAELDRAAGGFMQDRDVAWLRIKDLEATNARLLDAITTADLQIGDGHIGNARDTLHAAMDAT